MIEELNIESKNHKLAAARKKLKEYQERNLIVENANEPGTSSGQVSSNISERSLSESHLNGGDNIEISSTNINNNSGEDDHQCASDNDSMSNAREQATAQNVNTMQILINEKHHLNIELNKCRSNYRSKELEFDNLFSQHMKLSKQFEESQKHYDECEAQVEQLRSHTEELQQELIQLKALNEDQSLVIDDLKKRLDAKDVDLAGIKAKYSQNLSELELAQLRIKQLSDENGMSKNSRIEVLSQTQYMYEQQIRDLQAMVQQLNMDKEQANTQYQTYVQQLNTQQAKLNERNGELLEEIMKLQEREKQLIGHIQQLEKEIQKNISLQQQYKDEQQSKENALEDGKIDSVKKLEEQINELELERHEFQLKIKSQEDRLLDLNHELEERHHVIERLQNDLERINSEQPNNNKLLASMESDKVAAARALTQNVELKQQLDELELRFVQLTNEKAELMNRLDAEQYNNREMRNNINTIEERLRHYDETYKFKDEEMIRLSNENESLKANAMLLEEQLKKFNMCERFQDNPTENPVQDDAGQSNEKHEYNDNEHNDQDNLPNEIKKQNAPIISSVVTSTTTNSVSECTMHVNVEQDQEKLQTIAPYIPTEKAVEKLQERFTRLISQVADLTDEKQRLEHLVLQLQSETETIGEYIALYQTQRRILKQREYERLAQAQLLQTERQQMHERLAMLNNLVNSLAVELPEPQEQQQQIIVKEQQDNIDSTNEFIVDSLNQKNSSRQEESPLNLNIERKNLHNFDSQEILHKIHDIITEIKQDTKELPPIKNGEDQLACCMGRFEIV